MKTLFKTMVFTGLAVVVGMVGQAGAVSINVFNTGVDANGGVALNGATELNYSLTSSPITPTPTPLVRALDGTWPQNGAWIPENTTSAWIVPNFDVGAGGVLNHPDGLYVYQTTFDLTGLVASSAAITGQWATDNTSTMFINGVDTGNTISSGFGFAAFEAFSINSGFVAGINILEFRVTNEVQATFNPTGLRVEMSGTANLSGTANPVPEPSTLLLLGTGIAGLIGYARRRNESK